jgi:hypothetical protein
MPDWQPGWAFTFEVDGETVGPVRSEALYAHRAARESIAGRGGVARVLRASGGDWRAVATYTDAGATARVGAAPGIEPGILT